MAVVSVCEVWRGRTGNWDIQAKRNFVRVFRVKVDSQFDGPLTVLQAPGLPLLGEPYFDASGKARDFLSPLVNYQVNQDETDPWTWEVVCNYESQQGEGEPGSDPNEQGTPDQQPGDDAGGDGGAGGSESSGGGDPTFVPAEVTFTWEQGNKPLRKDMEGNPVVLSNGLEPDPPIEVEWSDPVLIVSYAARRGSPSASYANTLLYQDAVNSDTITLRDLVAKPGEARIRGISNTQKITNNIVYDWVSIEIVFRFKLMVAGEEVGGWNDLDVLNSGLMQINAVGDLVPCVDDNGDPVTSPAPLDANGKQLTTAQIQAGNAYTYKRFKPYRTQAFGPLGIFT